LLYHQRTQAPQTSQDRSWGIPHKTGHEADLTRQIASTSHLTRQVVRQDVVAAKEGMTRN